MQILKKILRFFNKPKKIITSNNDNNYPKSFANYKPSRTKILADQREESIHLTPRDILIEALRELDSGEVSVKKIVLITQVEGEYDSGGGYAYKRTFSGDALSAQGLIATALMG